MNELGRGRTRLERLGGAAYRRRRVVIVLWLVGLVAGVAIGGGVFDKLQAGISRGTSSESERAYRLIDRYFRGQGPSVDAGAFVSGSTRDPGIRVEVDSGMAAIRRMPGVAGVQGGAAADGSGYLIGVDVEGTGDRYDSALLGVESRLHAIRPGRVSLGNGDLLDGEMNDSAKSDLERAELIALPLILLIMFLIFRSVRIALIPLVVAVVSIAASLLVLLAFASVTQVSIFAVNVVTMLGLGLAVDYSLLAITRFREEVGRGLPLEQAVARTVATAGRTILFSGLTVAVSLAGLVFLTAGFRSVAYGGIGIVVVGLLAGLTLIPALLGVWGGRIRPTSTGSDHGAFFRLSRLVQRRAPAIVPVAAAALVLLAAPFWRASVQDTDYRYLPRGTETRSFFSALARHFPDQMVDPIQIVALRGAPPGAYAAYARHLRALPNVRDVGLESGTSNRLVVIDVMPATPTQSEASYGLVREIRAERAPFGTFVTGKSAEFVDEKADLVSRLPIVVGFVALATFVLLFLMTGSIVVPLKALVMNVLSLGASFGALVWVFQDGHLSGLIGFSPTGSVDLVAPVLIFAFAFGLSMDYEVFLLSRIKEAYERFGDNDHAVAVGLQRTGRVVTNAALLMAVVFVGFAAGTQLTVKQVGLGLVLAVAIDATVIRMLLVPATMKLMGRWNWWAPGPLRRLHGRIGIREAAPEAASMAAPDPAPSPGLRQVVRI